MWGNVDIPIQVGQTGYNGRTIDSSNLQFTDIIGSIRVFGDKNPNLAYRNGNLPVTKILLRNKTGAAILPSQVMTFSNTVFGETGAAAANTATQLVCVADEYLPAAGCPNNDVCWFTIKGPCTALFATVSGAKAAGQLQVGPSTTSGKMDFTGLTPGNATVAQQNATYGCAFTEGAIADQATSARIIMRDSFPF